MKKAHIRILPKARLASFTAVIRKPTPAIFSPEEVVADLFRYVNVFPNLFRRLNTC
jgi:hypothetical protein